MSYHKDLDEYTDTELRQELARREAAVTEGICDYCGRGGLVEPACMFPNRHHKAGVQAQLRNCIAAGIPQVGVTEVRFNTQGTQSGRFQSQVENCSCLACESLAEVEQMRRPTNGCGKTGCPKPGVHKVQGGLLYHACDEHLNEIEALVAGE